MKSISSLIAILIIQQEPRHRHIHIHEFKYEHIFIYAMVVDCVRLSVCLSYVCMWKIVVWFYINL